MMHMTAWNIKITLFRWEPSNDADDIDTAITPDICATAKEAPTGIDSARLYADTFGIRRLIRAAVVNGATAEAESSTLVLEYWPGGAVEWTEKGKGMVTDDELDQVGRALRVAMRRHECETLRSHSTEECMFCQAKQQRSHERDERGDL